MNLSLTAKIILGATTALVVGAVVANSYILAKIDHLNSAPRLTPKQRKLLELQDMQNTVATFINDPHYVAHKEMLQRADTHCNTAKHPDISEEALVDAVTHIKEILINVKDLVRLDTAE